MNICATAVSDQNDVIMSVSGSMIQMRRVGNPATCHGVKDVFRLSKDRNVIGRNSQVVDFYINSSVHPKLISREHAVVTLETRNGDVAVFDVTDKSVNGTFVNDAKIQGTVPLAVGDVVTFGHLQGIRVRPWQIAKQPNSEFRFMIEKVTAQVSRDVSDTESSVRQPLAILNHSQNQTWSPPPPRKSESTPPPIRTLPSSNHSPEVCSSEISQRTVSPVLGGSSPVLSRDGSSLGGSHGTPSVTGSPDLSTVSSSVSTSSPIWRRKSPVLGGDISAIDRKSPLTNTDASSASCRSSPVSAGNGTPRISPATQPGPSCKFDTELGETRTNHTSVREQKSECSSTTAQIHSVRATVEDIEKRNSLEGDQTGNETLKISPRICSFLPPTSGILPKQLILGVPACRVQSLPVGGGKPPKSKSTPPGREFNFPSLQTKEKSPPIGKNIFDFTDGESKQEDSGAESDEDIFALTTKVRENVARLTQEADEDSFSPNLTTFDAPRPPVKLAKPKASVSLPLANSSHHNTRRKTMPLIKSALSKSTLNNSVNSRKRKSDGVLPSAKRSVSDVEACSAVKCLKPAGSMIPWVQCDDCDSWFHTKCSGCKFEDVRKASAAFHCGCV